MVCHKVPSKQESVVIPVNQVNIQVIPLKNNSVPFPMDDVYSSSFVSVGWNT